MTSSQQAPGDVRQLSCLLQTIKGHIESQTDGNEHSPSRKILQTPAGLPSKEYGPTNLSDQAQAVLGDVYHFYEHDHTEQRLILQEFKEQMENFCRRQDKRDENLQCALHLITKINHGLRSKGSTSESPRHTLSARQLLSMVKQPDRKRSADQTLDLCRSIAQRRQSQLTFVKPTAYMAAINLWLNARGPMLMHLTSKSPAEDHMADIIVQLTTILRDSGFPTIWSLPVRAEQNNIQSMLYDILSQLLQLQPELMVETSSTIGVNELEDVLEADVWIEPLRAVLDTIPKAFVILNLSYLSRIDQADNSLSRILSALADQINDAKARGNVVKVLVHTGSVTAPYMPLLEDSENYIACAVDAIPTNVTLARRLSAHARSLTRQSLLAPVLSND